MNIRSCMALLRCSGRIVGLVARTVENIVARIGCTADYNAVGCTAGYIGRTDCIVVVHSVVGGIVGIDRQEGCYFVG